MDSVVQVNHPMPKGRGIRSLVFDENEAFQAYRSGNRNYLLRVTYSIDRPRKVERWDEEQKCWKA